MKTILVFGETATLSHVGRPYTIARSLNEMGYNIHFASDKYYDTLLPDSTIKRHAIYSQSPGDFSRKLRYGLPLFSNTELRRYIDDDISLMERIKPDLVIGDLRLSLNISARIKGIPYVNIVNAHWSPYSNKPYILPNHPLTRFLGYKITSKMFTKTAPLIFKLHLLGMNKLRKNYHLEPYQSLEAYYSDGDVVWYPDMPELIPLANMPESHRFIGPVDFAPSYPEPAWLDKLPRDKPLIYFTLGTSGDHSTSEEIMSALQEIKCNVLFANSGKNSDFKSGSNVYAADYLPGSKMCQMASLALINGGIPSIYQALAGSTPVIGFCSNIDQYISMHYVEKAGLGKTIRKEQCNREFIRKTINDMIMDQTLSKKLSDFNKNVTAIQTSELLSSSLGALA